MKKISITAKVTLLYMITLIVISAVFLAVMLYAGSREAGESARRVLMEEVADASEEINRTGSNFTVDSNMQFYHNGVYLSIYDDKKKLIEGRRPASLTSSLTLRDKTLRKQKDSQGRVWYVYDSRFVLNGKSLWVRGVMNDFAEDSTFRAVLRLLMIGIPLLIAAAAVVGYFITKRAFRPVGQAVETAAEITRDGDLTRRIPAISGGDEVSRMTDAFNRMFDRLEKQVEDEKRFTNDAAHELRTPLTVIRSQSEYALEDESYRERALEVINSESKTMSQMVNQLLMLARGDAGRLEVHAVRLDLGSLSRDVVEQQEAAAEEKGVELRCEAEDGVFAFADEFMTIRILLNLISNALKYGVPAKEGTSEVETADAAGEGSKAAPAGITVRVRTDRERGMARLSVEDHGPGIPAEELEKVWDRFYRGSAAGRKEYSGEENEGRPSSGLGLAIVKALAEAQGGRVAVESQPYEKTVFTVWLPEDSTDNDGKEAPA
ncbi:MAG: sensor histidine kinase [Anaerovoracaceae bacterium]